MSQSKIVPVKLADNKKSWKTHDTHKKNHPKLWVHIKNGSLSCSVVGN